MVLSNRGAEAMEGVCNEVLALILTKLPVLDAIRAKAVCRRWRDRMDAEKANFKFGKARSYCPLVFKRIDEQHTWAGYQGATGKWEALPSLSHVPRIIHLAPIPGSGDGLLGFKIFSEFSGYIVGNPYSQKWKTLPRSSDCWGDAAMFMTSDEQDGFRVVTVRDEDTQIYKSEIDMWTNVGQTPRSVVEGQAVSRIKSKGCAAVCNDRLYTTSMDGNVLISFDMRTEQWIAEMMNLPLVSKSLKKVMQVLQSAGTIFAVTEEVDSGVGCRDGVDCAGIIEVWGLGMESRQFSLTVKMPVELQQFLRPKTPAYVTRVKPKLRSVGHGHQLFFWRHKGLSIVSYDLFTRKWYKLPEFVMPDIVAQEQAGEGDGPQITVDTGFFEPKNMSG